MAGDLGQLVPVRVQRGVDVDRKAHERWYGSGVSGFIGQVRALPANAFLRGRPDPDYADGDDSTWTTLATYSNLNKNTTYTQKTFDVSAFKGKTELDYATAD